MDAAVVQLVMQNHEMHFSRVVYNSQKNLFSHVILWNDEYLLCRNLCRDQYEWIILTPLWFLFVHLHVQLASEKFEEGERALQEARQVEAEHQTRLRTIHAQMEQLRQQEQHLHQVSGISCSVSTETLKL